MISPASIDETAPYCSSEEIETLVRDFESCTLPGKMWTHYAHLTVALWYLTRHDQEEATTLIRDGIQRYNHSRGIITTKENGYHETITLFSIWAIKRYLVGAPAGGSILDLTSGLISSGFGDRRFPLEYYSRDLLFSWEARIGWVEPDLKPLV